MKNPLIFKLKGKYYKIGKLHLKINSSHLRKPAYYLELLVVRIIEFWFMLHEEETEIITPFEEEEHMSESNLNFESNYYESFEEIFENPWNLHKDRLKHEKKKVEEDERLFKNILGYEYKFSWEDYPYECYEGSGKEGEDDSFESKEDEFELKENNYWSCYALDFYIIILIVIWAIITNSHFWLLISFLMWIYFLILILDSIVLIMLLSVTYWNFVYMIMHNYWKNRIGPTIMTELDGYTMHHWDRYFDDLELETGPEELLGVYDEEYLNRLEFCMDTFSPIITDRWIDWVNMDLEAKLKIWFIIIIISIFLLVGRFIYEKNELNYYYDQDIQVEQASIEFFGNPGEVLMYKKTETKDEDFTSKYFPTQKFNTYYDPMWNLKLFLVLNTARKQFKSSKTILGFIIEGVKGFRDSWTTDDEIRFREWARSETKIKFYAEVPNFPRSWIKKEKIQRKFFSKLFPFVSSFESPLQLKKYKILKNEDVKNVGHFFTYIGDIFSNYPAERQKENESILTKKELEMLKQVNQDEYNIFYSMNTEEEVKEYTDNDLLLTKTIPVFDKTEKQKEEARQRRKKEKEDKNNLENLLFLLDIPDKESYPKFSKFYWELKKMEAEELISARKKVEKAKKYDLNKEYPRKKQRKQIKKYLPSFYYKLTPLYYISLFIKCLLFPLNKILKKITFTKLKKIYIKVAKFYIKYEKKIIIIKLFQIIITFFSFFIYSFFFFSGLIFNKYVYIFLHKIVLSFIKNMCYCFDFYFKITILPIFYSLQQYKIKVIKFLCKLLLKISTVHLELKKPQNKFDLKKRSVWLTREIVKYIFKQFSFALGILLKIVGRFFAFFISLYQKTWHDKSNVDLRPLYIDDVLHYNWFIRSEIIFQEKKGKAYPEDIAKTGKVLYFYRRTKMSVKDWVKNRRNKFPVPLLNINDEDPNKFFSLHKKFPFFDNKSYLEFKYAEYYKYYKTSGRKLTIWETIYNMWIPIIWAIHTIYIGISLMLFQLMQLQDAAVEKGILIAKELAYV